MIRTAYKMMVIRKEEFWLGCVTLTLAAVFVALLWNIGAYLT
jgi:hypothetical protein